MVQMNLRYDGHLRCQATHGPSKTKIFTDAPTDNHGRGESFSPTDLVATGLGTCMLTMMGIVANKNGWNIDGATVSVQKHMTANPRRIGRIDVAIHVPKKPGAEAQDTLEKAALTCPVAETLGDRVDVDLDICWGA